jgi:hypothetical protein
VAAHRSYYLACRQDDFAEVPQEAQTAFLPRPVYHSSERQCAYKGKAIGALLGFVSPASSHASLGGLNEGCDFEDCVTGGSLAFAIMPMH